MKESRLLVCDLRVKSWSVSASFIPQKSLRHHIWPPAYWCWSHFCCKPTLTHWGMDSQDLQQTLGLGTMLAADQKVLTWGLNRSGCIKRPKEATATSEYCLHETGCMVSNNSDTYQNNKKSTTEVFTTEYSWKACWFAFFPCLHYVLPPTKSRCCKRKGFSNVQLPL